MKNNLRFITAVVLSIFFHSCGGQGDPFVGNWIVCNRPEYTCVISKKENTYNLHSNNGIPDLVLEKKGEDVLLAIAGDLRGTVRYDKITNHLFLIEVINKKICQNRDTTTRKKMIMTPHIGIVLLKVSPVHGHIVQGHPCLEKTGSMQRQ